MTSTPKQFSVNKVTDAYWRITFNNPPINLVNPETILELQDLVGRIEADNNLLVVVFDSAHPDFYAARYDMSRVAETPVKPGPSGLPTWIDMTTRLSALLATKDAFLKAASWPNWRARAAKARERAALGADFELRLGYHLGNL